MFLVDSNIIVYSFLPQFTYLRTLLTDNRLFVSEISRVEVLGYHNIGIDEESYFKDVYDFITIIFPSIEIFNRAIEIRKLCNLKLGDSIIAATALEYDLSIYSRNVKDFEKVKSLKCINPIEGYKFR